MTPVRSVISRFRLAGMAVIVGIAVVGALAYALVNNYYFTRVISWTVGPVSDALAEHGFAGEDPDIWRRMAERHRVAISVELPGREPMAFDDRGLELPAGTTPPDGQITAVRVAPDGRARVTFHWTVLPLRGTHVALLGGLVIVLGGVLGAAFWFLHHQLRPLSLLRRGVEAVGRGDLEARVEVVRDDEIGRVATAFNEMTGRVADMLRDRERLLADVSHELRSPIARMKVALELTPPSDKRTAIRRDLDEMEHLVAALLERGELRSRTAVPAGDATREIDLREIAARVVAIFADAPPGAKLVAAGPAPIRADPALARLLVQNLVDNAVKFSLPDSGPVEVRLESGDGDVLLRVLDDGVGLPDDAGERLFEPFVKLDPARGHHTGYGLGLDLCRRVVELHGGSIELRPRSPRGAEARVHLPTAGR